MRTTQPLLTVGLVALGILVLLAFPVLLYAYRSQTPALQTVPITTAIQEVQTGQVRDVLIEEDRATLTLNDGSRQVTHQATGDDLLVRAVQQHNQNDPVHPIPLKIQGSPSGLGTAMTVVLSIVLSLLPLVLLAVLIVLAARALARALARDPYERLARIADLRDRGVLTEDEFQREKRKLVG